MANITQLASKLETEHGFKLKEYTRRFKEEYLKAINEDTGKEYKELDIDILKEEITLGAVETILTSIVQLENDIKQVVFDSKEHIDDDEDTLKIFSDTLEQVGNLFEIYTMMYAHMKGISYGQN